MKILFSTYPWAFDCLGGGERQLLAYRHYLATIGITSSLFDQWHPRIKEHQLFHFFSVMPGSLQLCDHVKKQGLPIVISPNLWVTPQTRDFYPHQDIASLLPVADAIVVNSDLEADALSEVYSLPRTRFKTVHNGIEEEFTIPADAEAFKTQFEIRSSFVLNVANIEPRKNQLSFVRAIKSFPDLKLLVVGHIRDENYARRCFEEGGVQLRFIGPLPYNSPLLRSGLAACEFFAMPSTLETPSIAALEAHASGTPVLITREGSTTEYFGDSVVYIDPDSVSSIRAGIENIRHRPKIAKQNSKFLWRRVVNDLAAVYRDLT